MNVVHTKFFPAELAADTLYVSDEYNTTAHLCASGCGFRVVLPLGKGYWELLDTESATMSPSVHVPSCNSHYFIEQGSIRWTQAFSDEQSQAYARNDQASHNNQISKPKTLLQRIGDWIIKLFR